MNKRWIFLIVLLIIVIFSSVRFYTVNAQNDKYTPKNINIAANQTIDTGKGIKFHILKALKPIKSFDKETNSVKYVYILPFNAENTSNHKITLEELSPDGKNFLFFGQYQYNKQLMPYNYDLPDKYQFNTEIPSGKTVLGYVGLSLYPDEKVNYKNFNPESSKVSAYYTVIDDESNKRISYRMTLNN
ncbi:hypothetical protein NFC80_03445 [Bacillus halotolerans]|uniref:hypothetical protein n=1 Tax=Bacillus halotolerans TaxID=260554 RepID=UPI0021550306|nr:hypothetical protein [Bacillus halotolerans]MCR6595683.1 hypothetical protein [Bacillus halotolerans]